MFKDDFVNKVLKQFEGKITQIPPIYSAIKVNGKKLYEYARKAQDVEIPSRNVEIYEIELISISKEDMEITYRVHCSKGTYIRTLCEDISEKLGTVGFMKELQRTRVGNFSIQNSLNMEDMNNDEKVKENFISIEKFLQDKEKIELNSEKMKNFLNGVKIKYTKKDDVYRVYYKDIFIGTGIICNNLLKRDIVENTTFLERK